MEQAYFLCQDFHFKKPSSKTSSVQWYFGINFNKDCKLMDKLASECFHHLITETTEGMRAYFEKDFSTLSCIFIFK